LESLAQETSAITTTESAETRIMDFFMAGTVVYAAGQFNRRTPRAIKACNHFLMREMRTQDSVKN
jgi:ribosomal protein L31E